MMCILRLFVCTALLLQEAFHGKLLKKRTEPSGGILTRVFRNTSPGFGIDSSMSSTKGAGLVGIADFHLVPPGAHEMKEMEKGLKDVYKFRAANNYGLRTRKEVRTFILNIIDSNAARLTKQYLEEFIQLGKPGGAANMDSAVNKLFDFYMISLLPALLKNFSGSSDKISPISSSPREHMLRGASCLKELKECLKLERPQENFKKTEFAFVQVALRALYILHDQILISDKQVREFFVDEYITKTVGRHLVYIYGEEYPKLSKILNFKPDMEFLKRDSQTSELHWWLKMLDKPTEGKIIYRSMQAFFGRMKPSKNSWDRIYLTKWGRFLDDSFIHEFEWKGSSKLPELKTSDSRAKYLVDIWKQSFWIQSRYEFFASFWIAHFMITYNASDLRKKVSYLDSDFLVQYEFIKNLLEINEISTKNYSTHHNSQLDTEHENNDCKSDFPKFFQPIDEKENQLYLELKDKHKELLQKLELDEKGFKPLKKSHAFKSILEEYKNPSTHHIIKNRWLQPVKVQSG